MTLEILSLVLNAMLGGGLLWQFVNLKAGKAKARAEAEKSQAEADSAKASAKSAELENDEKAIRMYIEAAEYMKAETDQWRSRYTDLAKEVSMMRGEINKLTTSTNKILKLLDRISHENLEKIVEQIKQEINGKSN